MAKNAWGDEIATQEDPRSWGDRPAAQRDLPADVQPSAAGGGRGRVQPAAVQPIEPAAVDRGPADDSDPLTRVTPSTARVQPTFTVDRNRIGSVLEDAVVPEQPFNPAAGEFLSNRRNAETAPAGTGQVLTARTPTVSRTMSDRGAMLADAALPVRAAARAATGATQGAAGLLRAGAEAVGADRVAEFAGNTASAAGDFEAGMGSSKPVDGFGPKSPVPYLRDMGEGAAASLLTSGAAASAFGARAVIPLLSIQSAGAKYDEARKAGLEPAAALANAVPTGAFEAIGEKFQGLDKAAAAIGVLMNRGAGMAAKRTAAETLVRAGIREVPGEVVTYLGQTGVDLLPGIGIRQDLTMGQFLDGLRDTVVQSAMMGTAIGAGGAAARPAGAPPPDAEAMARARGFLATEDPRVARLKAAGEKEAAGVLERQLNAAAVDNELPALGDRPFATDPGFKIQYRALRTEGLKPAEAASRAAMQSGFEHIAGQAGLTDKAVAKAVEAARGMPMDKVPGFLQKFAAGLAQRGMGQALPPGAVEDAVTALRDDAMATVTDTLYSDTPAATAAAIEQLEKKSPQPEQAQPITDAVVIGADRSSNGAQGLPLAEQIDGTSLIPEDFTQGGTSDASPSKRISQGAVTDAKSGSDFNGADALLGHGLSALDVPAQQTMLRSMFTAAGDNDQVARRIVQSIPVSVVNNLTGQQFTPHDLLSNQPVLVNALRAALGLNVGRGAIDPLVGNAASMAAEVVGPDAVTRPSVYGDAAVVADNRGSHAVKFPAKEAESQAQARAAAAPAEPAAPVPAPAADTAKAEVQPAAGGTAVETGTAAEPNGALTQQQPVQQAQARAKGGSNARAAAWEKNPLMAFLAKHGLSLKLAPEFAPGVTERRKALVPGYGPVFRRAGLNLDLLAEIASQDGFLPPGTADAAALHELVARAFQGERIAPMYAEGAAEEELARRVAESATEPDAVELDIHEDLSDLTDLDLDIVDEQADNIPDFDAPSNTTTEAAMRSIGFSEQEIQDAINRETAKGPESARADREGTGEPVEGAEGKAAPADRGREGPPGRDGVDATDRPTARGRSEEPAGASANGSVGDGTGVPVAAGPASDAPARNSAPRSGTPPAQLDTQAELKQTPAPAGVSASGLTWELRDTGTLAIKGDQTEILNKLKAGGVTKTMVMQGGIMVGKTQVQKALDILQDKPAPAPAAKPLSVGTTPSSADPVTVKDGVVFIGKYEALDFDSGEPITVPAGATDEQVKKALRDAGVLGKRQKFFGGTQEAAAPDTPATPAQPPADRYAAGKALTKDQRKAVLKTLVDVYKAKNAPREQKGIGRDGNERYGYVYSPELFEKSDITGAMVRYHVTMPDGKIAHPSELFPDYTQADIDSELERREAQAKNMRDSVRRQYAPEAQQFDSVQDAGRFWDDKSDESLRRHGQWRTILPSLERTTLSNGEKFIMVPAGLMNDQAMVEAFADEGWKQWKAGGTLTAPTQQDVLDQQQRRENAEDLDQREQIQREASGFQLQAQAPEQRKDSTGDMFGGPTVDDFQKSLERSRKPSAAPEGPDLFASTPEVAEPDAKPAAEMSAAELLRAAADKMEAAEKAAAPATKLESEQALWKRINAGTATLDEFKAGFEAWVSDKPAIVAEMMTKKKDDLLRIGGPYFSQRYKSETKPGIADALWRDGLGTYSLGKSVTYGMGKDSYQNAVRRQVEATDDAELAQHAEDIKAAKKEREQRAEEMAKAIDNPQSLGDYESLIRAKAKEAGVKTLREALMLLTPDQRAEFDRLGAAKSREARKGQKEEQQSVRVAGQQVDGQIIETKHTQKGYDLFVVQLAERVSREDYETLNTSAKRMGGYYSSFRGRGAVPGFQFKDRATADAFVKLANGDSAEAQQAVDARRDAYADDRSQTAVERLTEMADKMQATAEESLGRERKANTERRARFAAAAEAAASADKAMAKTMRNIAKAIEDGNADMLARVRTKSQVEMLTGMVRTAKDAELRARYPAYADQEKRKGEPATADTASYAEFPTFTAFRSDLASLARQLLEVDGTKKIGAQLMKVADDVSDAFTKFAKEDGNLFKLSAFSVKAGDDVRSAIFPDRDSAERAIKRSGLTGKAIVFPEKRGVNRIILSPSEAISRGIWTGDNDKRITLTKTFGQELVQTIGRRASKSNRLTTPWQFETASDRLKALARLGIETPSEFRTALREFIGLQEQAQEADRVKMLERAMVGRKKDGLDFFPTPQTVADEMVETADIKPDMAVLEPSAGMGHIADRIRAAGAEPDVIEMSGERRELLEAKGFTVVGSDFMELQPRASYTYGDVFRAPDGTEGIMRGGNSLGRVRLVGDDGEMVGSGFYNREDLIGIRHNGTGSGYDRIIMNPPFSDRRDAEHVQHAYTLLKPGGRLVAIMGEGVFFGQDKKAEAFRNWLAKVGGTDEKLAEGTFMDPTLPVNTGVNARMVVIDKPAGDEAPSFSRGQSPAPGLTPTEFTQSLSEAFGAKVADRLQEKGVVVPLADQTKLPAHVVPFLRDGDIVFGFYDPKTNRTYAVLENLTPGMVKGLAMHEVGVHYGFEAMLGKDKYAEVMKRLDGMQKLGSKAVRAARKEAEANAARPVQVPEETLAYLVQNSPELSLIKEVIAKIKAFLFREFGIGGKYLTEADLHMLAKAAVQHAARLEPGGVEVPAFMRAYHGTPHSFDKFSTDKIGTGEGAQAYGWGLYFAGKKEIAEHYRTTLAARANGIKVNGLEVMAPSKPLAQTDAKERAAVFAAMAVRDGRSLESKAREIEFAAERARTRPRELTGFQIDGGWGDADTLEGAAKILRQWSSQKIEPVEGQLYEVEIPEEGEYLLWDKPLSEQPAKVRNAILNGGRFGDGLRMAIGNVLKKETNTGQDVYKSLERQLGSDRNASDRMFDLGIKGIKYLDGVSRNRSLNDVKREFLSELPEDAGFDEVMDLIGEGTFSPANEAILTQLAANDWLGFDYPAQAISAALSGKLSDFDASAELVKAVSDAQDGGTYNYVVFSADDVAIQNQPAFMRQNEGMANRKDVVSRAKAMGLPATGTTEQIARLVDIAEADPSTWSRDDFKAIAPHLSIHQDNRPGSAARVDDIMRDGLNTGMVDSLGNMVRGGWTWARGLKGGDAYVFISGALKFDGKGNPRLAPGNKPLFHIKTEAGQGIYEAITGGAPEFSRSPATDTKAFKEWFGDSVVTESGKPKVMYHGTRATFTEFDRKKSTSGLFGTGFYFTDNRAMAEDYADGGNVMEVYLSLKNPAPRDVANRVVDQVGEDDADGIRAELERLGYDGVMMRDAGELLAVAFEPEQIKSATGNRGTFDPKNPDIRFSRTGNLFEPDAWSAPEPTRTDRAIYELQNGRIDLKRVQQAITAARGAIDQKFDAQLAETLYPGRVARRTDLFLDREVKPLLEAMAKSKATMDELADYLIARHAPERNAQVAKVNPDLPDGGAGRNSKGELMTNEAAAAYLASIPAARRAELATLAVKVDAITAGTRGLLVAEGLEKADTVAAWQGAYKNYVPLFKDEAEHPHPQGTGFNVRGPASKRSTGSTKQVTNVIAHVLMQREAAIARAEKNRVGLALYGLALSNPNREFWTTIKPGMSNEAIGRELQGMGVDPTVAEAGMDKIPTIRTVDPLTQKVVDRPNPIYKSMPGAITLKVNGEDRVLLINTTTERGLRMAEALKNLDGMTKFDLAGNIVGKTTRWMAAINTQYNPAFGLVNLVRDTLGGSVNIGSTKLRGKGLKVLADVPMAMQGIARELSGGGEASEWSKLWKQFQDDGGRTGYREVFAQAKDRADAIERELKAAQSAGKLTPGKVGHAVLDLLDGFNTTLENAVRLAAYKNALDAGMTRPEAARLGRELTVDFNRKGRLGRELGPLYAFFNASVQGGARTLEALRGPTGAKIIAGGLSLGALQALMLLAAGYDDDEIQEYVKTRAFIIPLLGSDEKKFVAIPYPLGLHVIPNVGRVATELALNGGKDIGRRTFDAVGEIAAAFNPLGGGNIFTADGALKTVAPTVVDPLIEAGYNRNFAGNRIERESRGENDTRPGYQRAKEATLRSTSGQAYLGISKAVNWFTGGTAYEKGLASPTPEMVRHIAQTAGGGVLREFEKTVDSSVKAMTGEKVKMTGIPVLGRFYGEVDDDQVQASRYYDKGRTIDKLQATLKAAQAAGDGHAMLKLIEDNPELGMARAHDQVQREIAKLNKAAISTVDDPATIKAIDQARVETMRSLNEAIRAMEQAEGKLTPGQRLRAAVAGK